MKINDSVEMDDENVDQWLFLSLKVIHSEFFCPRVKRGSVASATKLAFGETLSTAAEPISR